MREEQAGTKQGDAVDAFIDAGLKAVEEEDLDRAEAALEQAQGLVGENHVRVLHLGGLIAWANGRLENAAGFLQQAVDLGSRHAEIYLDCAECLAAGGNDLQEAEAVLRTLLGLDGIPGEQHDQARLLLSQIRLDDDDVEEALEVLDEISAERKTDPVYLSTRAMVLEAAGQSDDALAALRSAVEKDPIDPDLHYQLGLLYEGHGKSDEARASMLKVLELDSQASAELDPERTPLTPDEAEALRAHFEEGVLSEVPEPVLKRVASVPITVQERPSAEQVKAGMNPRTYITFHGQPETPNAAAKLEGIVIMRDLLLEEVDTEDELVPMMFVGLFDEMRAFFRMESLQMVSA